MSGPIFFEKVLIKLLFNENNLRDRVMPFLDPSIFDDHKNIQIIKDIINFNNEFDKFPTVSELKIHMKDEGAFNQLFEIMDMDVSEYKTEFLTSEIEDFFRKKLIHHVNVDVAMALNNDDMEDMKESPDRLREAIAFSFDTKIGLDFLDEEERLYNYLHNRDKFIKTPIRKLNRFIDGGWHQKSLSLFMAETNLGKSLIMTSLAVDTVLRNKNVLYVTCEMSEDKISERVMSNLFDVDLENLRLLNREAFHKRFEKLHKEVAKKLIIKEYPPKSINTNHIRTLLKELEVRKKFKPDIVYVDYLGIMLPIRGNRNDNTYLEVKRISEELRALAVDLEIPIITASQVTRQGIGSAEIDLKDISESIGTAATADIIIGVTQSNELKINGKYEWIILKNRYGINKIKMTVDVDYEKMRISNDDSTDPEEMATSISSAKPNSQKAIEETKNALNKDRQDKWDKMTGNFDGIE